MASTILATKLSELQRLLRERKVVDGRERMVRSIQQSLRVEGYEVSAQVIGADVDRLLCAPPRR
jgi:hypothetical protein